MDTEHNPGAKQGLHFPSSEPPETPLKMNELDLLLVRGRDAYSGDQGGGIKSCLFQGRGVQERSVLKWRENQGKLFG